MPLTFAIKGIYRFVLVRTQPDSNPGVNGSPFNSLYALCALIRALVKMRHLVLRIRQHP